MADVVIRNVGTIVSGDLAQPLAAGDTIVVRDGRIAEVGAERDVDTAGIERVIDADGATVLPGLIDSHAHPTVGDFSPRQRMLDFIESCLHGGVTTMISAGEVHVPGRPRDAVGTKALAILAARAFGSFRPGGVKVRAGAVLLEPGLTEADFAEMAAAGVRQVGEIGVSGVSRVEEAEPMVRRAQRHGMRVIVHTGGASIPGSEVVGADVVLALRPDIAAHVNGGPTAPALGDVERILAESRVMIEVVQCGNVRALREVIRLADRRGDLDRVLIGTDAPSGTGIIPLGILRTISWVAAFGEVAPARAVALATGNTARLHGLQTGVIRPGLEADLVIADAPRGSEAADALGAFEIGDTPAVAAVLIDGAVRVYPSRNTPPARRQVRVPWMAAAGH